MPNTQKQPARQGKNLCRLLFTQHTRMSNIMTTQRSAFKTLLACCMAAWAQHAAASGYHFGTQSVTAQSTANSSTAEAADASTLFYNPAGLTNLETHQISGAVNLVMPHIDYSEGKASYIGTNTAVSGKTSGTITDSVVPAPHVYGAYKLNDRLTLGLGVYVPFGSSTEYDRDSVLRYNMNQLGLTTIAVEPVAAFKATEDHSFGAGLIAQHSSAELRKYADFGRAAGRPGQADGYAKVKGSDWGFGYHLGWLWNVNDRVRVGVNYRSKVSHNLSGTANWSFDNSNPSSLFNTPMGAPLQQSIRNNGYAASENASVKIITPESLSLHGMYRANSKLNLFGDITWTRHSRFNRAELLFQNTKQLGGGRTSNRTVLTPNWRNTFKVGLGASYQYNDQLQLRGGVAFDQSPVRNATYRLNTLPDGNRIWFSVGAKYAFNQHHSIDVAYSHIHINDTVVRSASADGTTVDSKGASSARFKNYANILGVQYNYKF